MKRSKKSRGIYGCIGAVALDHPKAFIAEIDGWGLWAWATVWCRLKETDGIIPVKVLRTVCGQRRVAERAMKKLLDPECGWFKQLDEERIEVFNYEVFNETKVEIDAAKLANRRRVAQSRNGDVTRYDSITETLCNAFVPNSPSLQGVGSDRKDDPESQAERPSETKIVRRRTNATDDGMLGQTVETFRETVALATRSPVSALGRFDIEELFAALDAHAGGLRGELLLAWIRTTVSTFVAHTSRAFWGSPAKAFRKWLDAGRPSATDRANAPYRGGGRIMQEAPPEGSLWEPAEVIG